MGVVDDFRLQSACGYRVGAVENIIIVAVIVVVFNNNNNNNVHLSCAHQRPYSEIQLDSFCYCRDKTVRKCPVHRCLFVDKAMLIWHEKVKKTVDLTACLWALDPSWENGMQAVSRNCWSGCFNYPVTKHVYLGYLFPVKRKRSRSEDASWPENMGNVQICLEYEFLRWHPSWFTLY